LLSATNYVLDALVVLVLATAGYHVARQRQMAANYSWKRTD
jgi:hypothetical protein